MIGDKINFGDAAAWKAARAQLDETSEYISDNYIIKDSAGKAIDGYYQVMALEDDGEFLKSGKIAELQSYLDSTDWYVIRQTETGALIPAEILESRRLAREEISVLREGE